MKVIFGILLVGLASLGAAKPPPVVFTSKALTTELSDIITYPARVESKVNSTIYSESDGVVAKIVSPLGTKVKKGSKLIVVNHSDPQYAPMAFRSSVDGVVSQVAVTEGTRVTRGQTLLTITDPQNVKVIIEVAAQDVAPLQKVTGGELKAQGLKEPVPLKLKGLSPTVDLATGTATAELEAVKKQDLPAPGLVGQVTFKVNKRKSIVFPEHALVYRDDGVYLRIVKDGVAKKIPITIGSKQRGQVEILSGIVDGDEVVERSSGFVADGDKVTSQSAKDEKKEEEKKVENKNG